MQKRVLVFLLFSLLLVSCDGKIAAIGDTEITKSDIDFRCKVSDVYYPKICRPYIGLTQFIEGVLSVKVLESLGYEVDKAALEQEEERIDRNTKDPMTLKKIKDIFGKDHENYLNIFIKMIYGKRVLYNNIFLKSKEIHQGQREKALSLIEETLKKTSSFEDVVRSYDLEAVELTVSSKEGIWPINNGKKNRPRENKPFLESAKKIIEMLSKTKNGSVYQKPIEWPESFQVIKRVKNLKDGLLIESVSIPKISFDDWFWPMAKKIPVKIYDEELKGEFLKNVSWAKNVNITMN